MKPKASDVQSAQQTPDTTTKLPAPAAPSRQAVTAKTRARAGRVTGKLAIACTSIIEEGHELDVAAKAAGLTTRALRLALEKPHVIAWVKQRREVFRAYVCAQNIHHAKKMRDTSGNAMAQLGAMKLIEQIGDDAPGATTQSQPGLLIIVQQTVNGATSSTTIEQKPMKIVDNATGIERD